MRTRITPMRITGMRTTNRRCSRLGQRRVGYLTAVGLGRGMPRLSITSRNRSG